MNASSSGGPLGAPARHSGRYLAYLAFAVLGVVWGASFIATKWAAVTINAEQIALLRLLFGFLPLLVIVLSKRALKVRDWRHAHHFLVMAVLTIGFPYLAYAKGTVLLPSSVAGMLSGAIPIFTFVIAWMFLRDEPSDRRTIGGVVLGFLGVFLIAQPWSQDLSRTSPAGVLWLTAGSLSVGASFVYTKRFVGSLDLSPLVLTTYQTGLAFLLLLAITDLRGIDAVFADRRALLGLVLILGFLGTGLAFILYYWIVDRLGAVTASGVTYIPPIIALLIGTLLVGETIQPLDVAAMAAILLGVAVLQSSRSAQEKLVQ